MSTADHDATAFGYGLIGCGSFGQFCLEQYGSMQGVRCVAVADARADRAARTARRLGLEACATPEALLARSDVHVVHVATPPAEHKRLVLTALAAGRHVLCEKPLALTVDDAREMLAAARQAQRLLAVNLIMRYDPICAQVKRIIDAKLLGEPLHGFFENDARDESLPPDHWFWDRRQSGGIFIEHGVHFFDLFRWWLGPGRVRAAQRTARPGTDLVEQVNCTVAYGSVLVNFYHGFHQATRMDRQEMRLVFERGSIRLFEWVPTRVAIDCLADRATLQALKQLLGPTHEAEAAACYAGDEREITSRHKNYQVDGRYHIAATAGMNKQALYAHVLRGLLSDQLAAIIDPRHARRVTEENGLISLTDAVEASRLADDDQGRPESTGA